MYSFLKKRDIFVILALFFLIAPLILSEEEKVEQFKIGNLALSSSQQPGPLIGFGQNMLDKGEFQLFSYVDYLKGHNKQFTEVVPTLLYGFTEDFHFFC